MLIWIWGRERLYARISRDSLPVSVLLQDLKKGKIHRVSGTAIHMSGKGLEVPTAYFQLPPGRVVELGAQIVL